MHRALWQLKALAHEVRIHSMAMRKVFQRGNVPDKIRFRFRSRNFMVKNKMGEVALELRELEGLTGPQQMFVRRELGNVRAAIRQCDHYLALPSTVAAPPPGTSPAPLPEEDLTWLDMPAATDEPYVPPVATPSRPAPVEEESLAFLDELVIPVDEADPEITGPVVAGVAHCPVCGDPDPADTQACPACGVAYHRECWEYYGGCAIYGCARANLISP